MIVYTEIRMRTVVVALILLAFTCAAGCGTGSPSTPLKAGQERKAKEQAAKAAPND